MDDSSETSSDEDPIPRKISRLSLSSKTSNTSTSQPAFHENTNYLNNFEYVGTGLKSNLHGSDFQLTMLMQILWRADLYKLSEFRLATELPECGKFDDVVFFWRNEPSEKWQVRFYQAKHKEAEKIELIKRSDLLSEDDTNIWQLSKYMQSFDEIQKRCQDDSLYSPFSGADIDQLVIITNADIEDDMQKYLVKCDGAAVDAFHGFQNTAMKTYQIKNSFFDEFMKTVDKASDLTKLAQMLAQCAVGNGKLEKKGLVKKYIHPLQSVLCQEVNDKKVKTLYAKFTKKFLSSPEFSEFREELCSEVESLRASQTGSGTSVLNFLENVKIKITAGLTVTTKNIVNPQKFAKQFYNCITRSINDRKEWDINAEHVGGASEIVEFGENVCVLGSERALVKTPLKIRFSTAFIKGRISNQSINDFRIELINLMLIDSSLLNTIAQYSLNIKLNKFSAEVEEYRELTLPSKQSSYKLFLSKLRFVVKYPNRNEVDTLLETEMKATYKNLNSEALKALLKVNLQNWMTNRTGTFYTAEKVRHLFQQMDANVWCWCWQGKNDLYFNECPKFQFENHQLHSSVQIFLAHSEMRALSLVFENLLIGRIRVVQSFFMLQYDSENNSDETLQRYTRMFGYVFLKLKQFSRSKFYKSFSERCQDANQWNLIVIECDVAEGEPIERLNMFLQKYGVKRKVILITQENHPVSLNVPQADQCKFSTNGNDLIESSWEKIGEKSIELQGMGLVLNDAIDRNSRHLIDAPTLRDLINGELVKIGGELKYSTGYEPEFYTARSLGNVLIQKEILLVYKGPDTLIISDNEDDFIIACEQCDDSTRNIHWLQHGNNLIWKRTYGSINNLRKYRLIDYTECTQEKEFVNLTDPQKLIIISDSAGMGKSTIISSLTAKFKSEFNNLWVIRIELNEHSSSLNAELQARKNGNARLRPNDPDSLCIFLVSLLFRESGSNFETELFKHALLVGGSLKVVVLFDGFDEISPSYGDIILDMVQGLLRTQMKKLIITTRPTMETELEMKLAVFVHHLKPLNYFQQRWYLQNFWTLRLACGSDHSKRINFYVKTLLHALDKKQLISHPLILRMLGEVLEKPMNDATWQSCEEYIRGSNRKPQLPRNLKSCNLYIKFVELKVKIYHEEKMRLDLSKQSVQDDLDEKFRELVRYHQQLAILALIEDESGHRTLLLPLGGTYDEQMKKIRRKIDQIENCKERCGLINRVIDGRPYFVHRTIAEYFLVCYVSEALTNEQQHDEFLKFFIAGLLSKDWFLSFFDTWLADESNRIRIADKTKLQIATIAKGLSPRKRISVKPNYQVLHFLLECFRNNTDISKNTDCKQDDFKHLVPILTKTCQFSMLKEVFPIYNPKQWYHRNFDDALLLDGNTEIWFWFCSESIENIQTFLYSAIKGGHLVACQWLHSNQMVDFMNEIVFPAGGGKPIHLAAKLGQMHLIDWLVNCLAVNVNARDHNGLSILHYAALGLGFRIIEHLLLPIESGGYGMDIHIKDNFNQSLIHTACYLPREEFFGWLLVNGLDINSRDSFGSTPLHLATLYAEAFENIIHLILSNGADVNAVRNDGMTALHLATTMNGDYGLEAYLKYVKAAQDNFSKFEPVRVEYPLEELNYFKSQIMETLVEKGANPKLRDRNGRTVLHWAAAAGELNISKWLLETEILKFDGGLETSDIPALMSAAEYSGNAELQQWFHERFADVQKVAAGDLRNCTIDTENTEGAHSSNR